MHNSFHHTIRSLAKSRLTYNKSRSVLTGTAIMLTTMLLTGLATGGLGAFDISRRQAVAQGNYHAVFEGLSERQLDKLSHHLDVEALEATMNFAAIVYDKMDGHLSYTTTYKEGIYHGTGSLTAGHFPEAADDICGSPAFFERMDTDAVIGGKITIPFRPDGKGEIQRREFTICGLLDQVDLSTAHISEDRLSYGAMISEALTDEYCTPGEKEYSAFVRVSGEGSLSPEEMEEKLKKTAADIGCPEDTVFINTIYLVVISSLGSQTLIAVIAVGALILFFSALVIYSIYYISVVTDIQELGRLKALGASGRQVKRLLVTESMILSAIAIPPGLILGFAIPALALPAIACHIESYAPIAFEAESIHMFSLPALICVILAILLTVRISIRKPLKTAGRISPVEAIRYQESSAGKSTRKGHRNITLFWLSLANLFRNKKRTIVTLTTMGLGCVLFICLSAVLASMDAENIARASLSEGDFRLALSCSWNDETYPENNFDSLQQENLFDDTLLQKIRGIEGVKDIKKTGYVLAGGNPSIPYFAGERKNLGPVSRKEMESLQKDVLCGEIDYDKMLSENGVVFTSDWMWKNAGLTIGDTVALTLYDGDRQIPFTVTISAVVQTQKDYDCFILPEELWNALDLHYDTTHDLFVYADRSAYPQVKTVLQKIADESEHFMLYSIDEELELGRMSVAILKLPCYLILIMVAVIGCINLINTMITGIVTRKREFGVLQAIGLSGRQLEKMLFGEGLFFTAGTLLIAATLGNLFGYLFFTWARNLRISGVWEYRYPLRETLGLAVLLTCAQLLITVILRRRMRRESLIERIRGGE